MSSQSNRFIATVVMAMLGLATPTWAQKVDQIPARNFAELSRRALLRSGDRLEVVTLEATQAGKFAGLIDDKLLLKIKGVTVVLEESSVHRIERRGDPVGNGALAGGATLGVVFLLAETGCDRWCFGAGRMAGAGFVLGAAIGLIGDALHSARDAVYERPASRMALNPGDLDALPNAYSSPIARQRPDPGPWAGQRFRLAAFGGNSANGGPSSEVEQAMRSAGLTGRSCFFGCVDYPTTTSSMQWGVEAGYQLSRRFGIGMTWMSADLGRVSGKFGAWDTLTLEHRLTGLATTFQVHPSDKATLSVGPALYSLRAGEAEWTSPDPTEYTARRLGLLASVHARPIPSFGVMLQYRLVGSSQPGPFSSHGLVLAGESAAAFTHPKVNYSHLFLGVSLNLAR